MARVQGRTVAKLTQLVPFLAVSDIRSHTQVEAMCSDNSKERELLLSDPGVVTHTELISHGNDPNLISRTRMTNIINLAGVHTVRMVYSEDSRTHPSPTIVLV